MSLTNEIKTKAGKLLAKKIFVQSGLTAIFDRTELETAVENVEAIFDTRAENFNSSTTTVAQQMNSALPTNIRTNATIEQKGVIVMVAAMARTGII